jgi:LPXTG-motif cell wall-anchored protein
MISEAHADLVTEQDLYERSTSSPIPYGLGLLILGILIFIIRKRRKK